MGIFKSQEGSAILPLIVVMPFLIFISTLYMSLSVSTFSVARRDQYHTHAQFAADAGADISMEEINEDDSWAGTGGEIELSNNDGVKTTYETTVSDNGENKLLYTTGRVYSPSTSTTPKSTVNINIDLRPVSSGSYSVVTGVGGLYMSNSSKIVGGDVFINGEVSMTNSAQIGLTTNPVNVQVAHQNCPEPATAAYPRLCNSGESGEPISITSPAHIYGTVKANNQTNGANMSNPGLTAGSVSAQPLPSHDRDGQKAAVASTATAATAGCSSGTKSWPANYKITGNLTISGTCKVTINGNVWITGTLEVRNSAQIIVSNTLGTTMPNIMVDGATVTFRNGGSIISNSSSTGAQLLTYRSSASCSPDCASVTGTDLYNSRNLVTINFDNSASAANSILYARWTRVTLGNSGGVGAIIGQTIELKNSATVTFGTAVNNLGTTYWVIDGYRRSF